MISVYWLLLILLLLFSNVGFLTIHRCPLFFIDSGGLKNFYEEQNMCMFCAFTADGDNGRCTNSEGFTSFLGLLGSIPFHNTGPDEHTAPDSR